MDAVAVDDRAIRIMPRDPCALGLQRDGTVTQPSLFRPSCFARATDGARHPLRSPPRSHGELLSIFVGQVECD